MSKNNQISRNMTTVRILEHDEADYAEVVFLESAQFYRLPKENPAFDSMIAALRDAMAKGLVVEVRLASLASNIIEEIKMAKRALTEN
jgi:hypothetical protein